MRNNEVKDAEIAENEEISVEDLHWNAVLNLGMAMGLFIVFLFGSVEMFIIIRIASGEIRKIPVIFLPFLNVKNVIPGHIPFEYNLYCAHFCDLDRCPLKYLVARLESTSLH